MMWMLSGSQATVIEATSAAVEYVLQNQNVRMAILNKLPKFLGSDSTPVQRNQSYFSIQQKYNRSRMLNGNEKNDGVDNNYDGSVCSADDKDCFWQSCCIKQ